MSQPFSTCAQDATSLWEWVICLWLDWQAEADVLRFPKIDGRLFCLLLSQLLLLAVQSSTNELEGKRSKVAALSHSHLKKSVWSVDVSNIGVVE